MALTIYDFDSPVSNSYLTANQVNRRLRSKVSCICFDYINGFLWLHQRISLIRSRDFPPPKRRTRRQMEDEKPPTHPAQSLGLWQTQSSSSSPIYPPSLNSWKNYETSVQFKINDYHKNVSEEWHFRINWMHPKRSFNACFDPCFNRV